MCLHPDLNCSCFHLKSLFYSALYVLLHFRLCYIMLNFNIVIYWTGESSVWLTLICMFKSISNCFSIGEKCRSRKVIQKWTSGEGELWPADGDIYWSDLIFSAHDNCCLSIHWDNNVWKWTAKHLWWKTTFKHKIYHSIFLWIKIVVTFLSCDIQKDEMCNNFSLLPKQQN